jgi:hypothetical protein
LGGKNLPDDKKTRATELIGKQSFEYGIPVPHTFGAIESLSPLYFTFNNDIYSFAPLDIQSSLGNDYNLFKNGKPYNAKEHSEFISYNLYNSEGNKLIPLSEIIKEVNQVGNKKSSNGESKDNSFYKLKSKRLELGWSFVIDADINLEIEEKEYLLHFGGEKNYCKIKYQQQEKTSFTYPKTHIRNQKTILCLSDCFIDGDKIKNLDFAVTDFVSFRNFRSSIHTKNYYALNQEQKIENSIVRSSRYQLLKRGSTLYFPDVDSRDKFAQQIQVDNATKIGFNKIITN